MAVHRWLIFKQLQVVRFCDPARNTTVYLVYSDRVIEGSPKTSLSTLPLSAFGGEAASRCADHLR